MRWCVAVFALVAYATPAAAQSTYVGASLVGDLARFSKVDVGDDDPPRILGVDSSRDGEALGFNVKIGRAITERWGVEFEYARSGEFENSVRGVVMPAVVRPAMLPIPDLTVPFGTESEEQHMSLGALAWVRHEIGDRVEMSYLGGIAFNRVEIEQEYLIPEPRLAIYPPVLPAFDTIEYSVGPAVGVEAAFEVGESAAVTGGIRLHGVSVSGRDGWLIRPNVGLRWTF